MAEITKIMVDKYVYQEDNKPSISKVKEFILKWDNDATMLFYQKQEVMLNSLFSQYPLNDSMINKDKEEIIFQKCKMVDSCYSTNLKEGLFNKKSKFTIVDNILNYGFDKYVQTKELTEQIFQWIDKIKVVFSSQYGTKNALSFVSKYCSRHNPEVFPIYDKYVRHLLYYLNKKYNYTTNFNKDDLKDNYKKYKQVIDDFKSSSVFGFDKEKLTYKQVDQYLWSWAKEILRLENEMID